MNEALQQLERLLDLLGRVAPDARLFGATTPAPDGATTPAPSGAGTAAPPGAPTAAAGAAAPARPLAGDAIDAERRVPARTTSVRSLRDDPVIQAFRTELINGMVRTDVVRQVLSLVNVAVEIALRR